MCVRRPADQRKRRSTVHACQDLHTTVRKWRKVPKDDSVQEISLPLNVGETGKESHWAFLSINALTRAISCVDSKPAHRKPHPECQHACLLACAKRMLGAVGLLHSATDPAQSLPWTIVDAPVSNQGRTVACATVEIGIVALAATLLTRCAHAVGAPSSESVLIFAVTVSHSERTPLQFLHAHERMQLNSPPAWKGANVSAPWRWEHVHLNNAGAC